MVGEYVQAAREREAARQQQQQSSTGYNVGKGVGSLGTAYGLNALASGSGTTAAATPVASTVLADGTAGFLMSDGTVAAANELGSAAAATPVNWGALGSGAAGAGLMAGGAYGLHKGLQNIEAGDVDEAALYSGGGAAGLVGGAGLLGSSLGIGGAAGLTSLGVLGPVGLAAAALGAGAAYGQNERWGKGHKDIATVRREQVQDQLKNFGVLDTNVGGIEGTTGFNLGDKGFVHVGEGTDDAYKIAMSDGELDPNVFINEEDRQRLQNWQDKGYHYGDYIDWTAPGMGDYVAEAAPLALLATGSTKGDLSQIGQAYIANALQMVGEDAADRKDWLKDRYAMAGYEGEEGANKMIADIGSMINSGAIDEWAGLAAQNAINRQYGLAGYGDDGGLINLEVDPSHQAAFDAHKQKEDEIRGI